MFGNYSLIDSQNIFQDILLPLSKRGNGRYFYQLIGVPENEKQYLNELYFLDKRMENEGNYVRFDNQIPLVDISKIVKEVRESFTFKDLTQTDFVFKKCFDSIKEIPNTEVRNYFKRKFLDTCKKWFQETNRTKKVTFDMVINFGVKMFCWTTSVYSNLFQKIEDNIPKVLYFGDIKDQEVYFLSFLFSTGCDILYVNTKNFDNRLLNSISKKKMYNKFLEIENFPNEEFIVPRETSGLKAQKEVDYMYFDDSNILKPYQLREYNYKVVPLNFSYEELQNLWNADGNIRPGFKVFEKTVYIPTICCKINGYEKGKEFEEKIKKLSDNESCIIFDNCKIFSEEENERILDMQTYSNVSLLKKCYSYSKLDQEKLKSLPFYRYKHLRKEVQESIINIIREEDVSEYTTTDWENFIKIVTVLFQMKDEIVDLLQKYDYGFQIPKIIVLHDGEEVLNNNDIILIKLLWKLGFDILFFSPIGYCDIEDIFSEENGILNIFQLEEMSQNFKMPFLKKRITNKESFFERIFKL